MILNDKKKMKIQYLILIILLSTLLSSCGLFSSAEKTNESFSSFYEEFNSDTTFQLQRINFPIEGYHEDLSGKEAWTEENWIYHKAQVQEVDTSQYSTTRELTSDRYVETVKAKNGSLYFSRTFLLKKGKWVLVKCINIEE